MVTLEELNPKGYPLDKEQAANQQKLLKAINLARTARNKPFIVTSGVRSKEHHQKIYQEKALKEGKKTFRVPMGSYHLKGAAVDIADSDGEHYRWFKKNEHILVEAGLWCEERMGGWLHFQCYPPKSGNRWFLP